MRDNPKFTAQHEAVLRRQKITDDAPGPIVRDMSAFLELVVERRPRASGTYDFVEIAALPDLNARLARPYAVRLRRPQQKSYPNIHGLFLLGRVSGLVTVEGAKAKKRLAPNAGTLAQWDALNAAERYVSLLEAWLLRGNDEVVGEHNPENFVMQWRELVTAIDRGWLDLAADPRFVGGPTARHTLALLDLFGFVEVEQGEPDEKGAWTLRGLRQTPFGDAMLALLRSLPGVERRWFVSQEMEEELQDAFRLVVRDLFPDVRTLLEPSFGDALEGVHTYKVTLGDCWRRIEIDGEASLDELANAILSSVEFDDDHLYAFEYKNLIGVVERACHPYVESSTTTLDLLVCEVPLRIGESMEFYFDFGDSWVFEVTLERVDPDAEPPSEPRVVASHGDAPEQYA